ncbi:hypothetical protein F441_15857 [Phytophthora nicotianae CJ01A1]|uniref:Uncharacterized protein n=1 Tax=Phytophthora nicotianae CJ01A1 TaxID=1317063 RepID=W2WBX1_PHYNI|nr:hypothetical protein F441_15857 [Phytophthora nicotianae CJ01A1]
MDLRYRHGLPRVLRGLTFSVNVKEEVDIATSWNIATILQDLVLFLNTVRSNSDPFGQFLDDQNVCKAWLQKAITSQDSADEKGSKFSVTASSDQEKRSSLEIRQIQQSIREELRGCTTLTIANRINNRAALGIGD